MERAIEAYHELLAGGGLAAESAAMLAERQRETKLVFGDQALSVSLRPKLVTRASWDHAVAAAEAIFGALSTLESALVCDDDLRCELDLDPLEEMLALADPGCRWSSPSSRLDSFFADEVRYVEYNAESPAGMAYGDVLSGVMQELPVMRSFEERWTLTPLPSRQSQLACVLQAFEDWGGAPAPSVAIVDWAGVPTTAELEMFRDFFDGNGVPCIVCEPESLTYENGRLRGPDGNVVTVVYKRVLTSELVERYRGADPVCRAFLDGSVVVVNTFRAKLLHKKMSLALLSDDRYASLYTRAQKEAIDRHIPWTRRVFEGASTRDGAPVTDLPAHIAENRETLVLKPNDEYGGKGVVLGWTSSQQEWEAALARALEESYVVQEAVPVPSEDWPIAGDSGVELTPMSVDMDPYLFGPSVGGALVRLSSSALLNVTAGAGSVVPTFVVEGEK